MSEIASALNLMNMEFNIMSKHSKNNASSARNRRNQTRKATRRAALASAKRNVLARAGRGIVGSNPKRAVRRALGGLRSEIKGANTMRALHSIARRFSVPKLKGFTAARRTELEGVILAQAVKS